MARRPRRFPDAEPFPPEWFSFCICNQRPTRTALIHGMIRRVSDDRKVERWWIKVPNEEAVAYNAIRGNYDDRMMLVINGRNQRLREVTRDCYRISVQHAPVLLRVLVGATQSDTMNEHDHSVNLSRPGLGYFRPAADVEVATVLIDNGAKAIVTSLPTGDSRLSGPFLYTQEVLFTTEAEAVAAKASLLDLIPVGS